MPRAVREPGERRARGAASARRAAPALRPLAAKLGVTPGTRVAIIGAPRGYARILGPLPRGARRTAWNRSPDVIHCFAERRSELERRCRELARALPPRGALWISWPKRASGRPSDLRDGVVRAVGLAHGLVDVKVCAVDATWSALKFVRRLKDR